MYTEVLDNTVKNVLILHQDMHSALFHSTKKKNLI